MNLLNEFSNDADGLAIIKDWLVDGESVDRPRAEGRSRICLQCPMHRPELWWEKFVKDPIAQTIRKWLEIKNKTALVLSHENELGMCSVCGCCLRLKCWTKLKHILAHTKPETMARYPSECWVATESKHESHVSQ